MGMRLQRIYCGNYGACPFGDAFAVMRRSALWFIKKCACRLHDADGRHVFLHYEKAISPSGRHESAHGTGGVHGWGGS